MTLKRRFFSAPTLTQAVLAAARHHSVDPDALDYKEVEKKSGFIKAPRGVVIDVDPDAPVKPGVDAERPSPPPVEPPEAPEAPETTEAPEPVAATEEATTEPPSAGSVDLPFEPPAADEPQEHPALASVDSPEEVAEPASEIASTHGPEAGASDGEEVRETPAEVADSSPFGDREPAIDEPAPSEAKALVEESVADPGTGADSEVEPAGDAVTEVAAEPPSAAPADEDLRETVAQAIDELAFLASLRVQATEVNSTDEGLEVELDGPDSDRLAARGGRSLLAIQHLLPRLLFNRLGKAPRCRVDSNGFHAARGERLERLAQKAADRVRSGGRSWLLEPMAPDERRLVHLALAEVPDIETESVGEGFLKRVRVAQVESAQSS